MIEIKDIEKLAELARLEIPQDEKESFRKDVDSILQYVSQIQEAFVLSTDAKITQNLPDADIVHNVMREDNNTHESGIFTETLLNEVPQREGNYVKVKKIL